MTTVTVRNTGTVRGHGRRRGALPRRRGTVALLSFHDPVAADATIRAGTESTGPSRTRPPVRSGDCRNTGGAPRGAGSDQVRRSRATPAAPGPWVPRVQTSREPAEAGADAGRPEGAVSPSGTGSKPRRVRSANAVSGGGTSWLQTGPSPAGTALLVVFALSGAGSGGRAENDTQDALDRQQHCCRRGGRPGLLVLTVIRR